jgi:nitroimidazol reductase NimA-like FMN-containing flavoprotein (pyridoxamine 5'-phosphate oxidase superfamily)
MIGGAMADNLIEHLEEHACLELLKEHHLGRVALVEQAIGLPVIYLMRGHGFRPDLLTGRCISVAELPSNWWG